MEIIQETEFSQIRELLHWDCILQRAAWTARKAAVLGREPDSAGSRRKWPSTRRPGQEAGRDTQCPELFAGRCPDQLLLADLSESSLARDTGRVGGSGVSVSGMTGYGLWPWLPASLLDCFPLCIAERR